MKKYNGVVRVHITLKSKGNGMLQNPMSDDTLDELIGVKSKAAKEKDIPLVDIAASRVLKNDKGKPGIKIEYLTACLAEAGRHVKNGKKQISTAGSTSIFGFLDFQGATFLPFEPVDLKKFTETEREFVHPKEGWLVDKRRGVLNNAGKSVAVGIVRPLFKHWELKLQVEVNTSAEDGCNIDIVKQLFSAAGTRVGLGDFRPAKKGPFGMFSVAEFEILE